MAHDVKTLIVGGGLSGLALAEMLDSQEHDYLLIEARDRFGGRMETEAVDGNGFDLGPAWFWPAQPRIAALIDRLELKRFDQFSDGILTFEDENGQVQRGRGHASMEGSWRLEGGFAAFADGLVQRVANRRLDARVTKVEKLANGIVARLGDGTQICADRIVFAMPPRIAAGIEFQPALPLEVLQTMRDVPTWMAGQAKAVAVYDWPFWREAGLSGDAMSRFGPMVEVHDASPATGGPYALFGFIGVPPEHRKDEDRLRALIQAQLVRLFGDAAANPRQLFIKDWAFDPLTATKDDQKPRYAHPTYALPSEMTGLWDGRVLFAGTEVAPQFGGYLEGALEAAENVVAALT